MDGSATGAAVGHDRSGRFVAGHTEYAAKRRRIAERVAALAQDFDAKSPVSQMLLRIAAEHIDQAATTRNSTLRVRATRAAAKVLDRIPRKPELPAPSLESYRRKREVTR